MSNFQDPPPPCPSTFKIFPPHDLGRSISNKPPSLMITNQLKEHIIQRGLLYVIRSFLQVGFRFQYQLINLSGFPKPHYLLFRGFILMCVQLSKNTTRRLLFINIHILSVNSFCYQPISFVQLENVNKLWKNNRAVYVNKRNQNKNKTKSRQIQVNHAFYYSI